MSEGMVWETSRRRDAVVAESPSHVDWQDHLGSSSCLSRSGSVESGLRKQPIEIAYAREAVSKPTTEPIMLGKKLYGVETSPDLRGREQRIGQPM